MGNNFNQKEKNEFKENKIKENIEKEIYKYNILFIGESGTGTKTSLIKRIIEGRFINIKNNQKEKSENIVFETYNKKIMLYLIDTDGDESRREFNQKYFKNADCIIMGYDVTNIKSFNEIVDYWYKKVQEFNKTNLIYLLGNKIDLKSDIKVKEKEAQKFTDENNIKFYSVSVKKNINIQKFLNELKSSIENDTNNKINNGIKGAFNGNPSKECYKVVLLGDCGVWSKSSLVNRLKGNKFEPNISSTCSGSYFTREVSLNNGKNVIIDIWDTPGQEKYEPILKLYLKDSDCIALGFDITRKTTFDNIKSYWYPKYVENSGINLIYLLGNKIDLFEQMEISENEVKKYCEDNNFRYFETSCLIPSGIEEFLQDLAYELFKR